MKSKPTFLSVALVVLLNVVWAQSQDYTFRVLINHGKNEIKSGNSWTPLKVGANLKSVDEVKVAENAFLSLLHVSSGKPLEVRESGSYKVSVLAAKMNSGPSVLNKYTDFVLSAIEKRGNTMAATGAVHRGTNHIKMYLPAAEFSVVYGENLTIQWEDDKTLAPFVVVFSSLYGDELYKAETSDNFVKINLSDSRFEKEDNIMVKVSSKDGKKESEEYALKRLSTADRDRIKNGYMEMISVTQDPSATNKLLMAAFYEDNKLLIDAATAYHEAVKIAPNVDAFREVYNDFLLRHGLKEVPAEKK